jgi:poly-gamma-glutamate capsule biosynthesis protein CapA/YwtB (metallophosphatase superfamily)
MKVLLTCLSLFLFLVSCQTKEKSITKTRKLVKKTSVVPAPVVKPIESRNQQPPISLAFVGDVIIHERLRQRESKSNEGYQVIWSEIQNYLDRADFTYANLEGPVAPELGGVSGFPMFNFPEKIISDLKDGGFDVVSTANNHALDRQANGIRKTKQNLYKYKLGHTGTLSTAISADLEQESWWYLTEIKNKKMIAWLSCTEMTNGMIDKENQVLYCYKNQEKIQSLILKLKEDKNVQAIILLPHWGVEEKFEIDQKRQSWAHSMLDLGASMVVGSHPHVVQAIETYVTADNRQTLIAYSLGNFLSNQPWIPNKASMIFYLKMQENETQTKLDLIDFKYVPLWMNRAINKDGTSKFRLSAVFDYSTVPYEAAEIWKTQLGDERRLKTPSEIEHFLKK